MYKKHLYFPSSPWRFISWTTFEFNKTVGCHADAFCFLKVLSVLPQQHYRQIMEEEVMLPSRKEVRMLF